MLDPAIVTEVTRRAVKALTKPADTSTTRKALAAELSQLNVEILTKLLVGKMTLTPVTLADGSKGYELSGKFRYDRLLSGILTPNSRGGTSPTGFEPVFQP